MYVARNRSVFMNNTRHLVYTRVAENPGASIQDIANLLHISHPTAAYHLKILMGNGLVVALRDGNRTRFFKRSEALGTDQQRLVAANRGERTRKILEIVRDRPMIHRKELAKMLSVPRTTVNWHVDRLVQMGLLAERRSGRYCQLFVPLPPPQGTALSAAMPEPSGEPAPPAPSLGGPAYAPAAPGLPAAVAEGSEGRPEPY